MRVRNVLYEMITEINPSLFLAFIFEKKLNAK